MSTQIGLERCFSFINCQLQPGAQPASAQLGARWRAITISRQSGSGAHVVAERLLEYLHAHTAKGACPWAVFDRNLVEKVLEDHHLPNRLAQFMREDRLSELSDTLDELFGLHPPSWTLVRQTADTILHLAELGNVIVIGRGANVITSKLDYVFHVRLIAPLEKRVDYIQKLLHLDRKRAVHFVHEEDRGRKRYLKKYFGKDIHDPLLYHITINTHLTGYEEAARIIGERVLGPREAKLESTKSGELVGSRG